MNTKRRVTATFYPDSLERAFYLPEVEIDGGTTTDPVDVACNLWLLGQVDYPKASRVALVVEGDPKLSYTLGRSLFGKRYLHVAQPGAFQWAP